MITGKAKEDCRVNGHLTLKGHVMIVPDEYAYLIEPEILEKVEVVEEKVEEVIEEAIVAKIKKPKRTYSRKKK